MSQVNYEKKESADERDGALPLLAGYATQKGAWKTRTGREFNKTLAKK